MTWNGLTPPYATIVADPPWPEVQATLAPSPWSNLRLTEDVNVQGRVL